MRATARPRFRDIAYRGGTRDEALHLVVARLRRYISTRIAARDVSLQMIDCCILFGNQPFQ
jgi:hypothetical protein